MTSSVLFWFFAPFVTYSTPGKKVEHENIECQFHFGATENEYYWQQLKLFDNIKIMAMLNARLVLWLNKLKRIEFVGRLLIFAGI